MKRLIIYTLIIASLAIPLAGCDKEVKEEPVVPLKLDREDVLLNDTKIVVDTIRSSKRDYSESILNLRIDSDNAIVVERRLLNSDQIIGYFTCSRHERGKTD